MERKEERISEKSKMSLAELIDEEHRMFKEEYDCHMDNISLKFPERTSTESDYVLSKGLRRLFEIACEKSNLKYSANSGRGGLTGHGYGELDVYRATHEDKGLIAEITLYDGQTFRWDCGVKVYSPLMDKQVNLSPHLSSIAGIEDKNIRKFIANFYEAWGEK